MFRRWFLRRQFSCSGKKIDKKSAQGALPKSRPLENPPAALTNCVRFFRLAMGGSVENSLKDTLSLRTSPQTGVALSKDSLRSQSVPQAFPWGKVARASPASARRMRGKSKKQPHPSDRHLLLSGEGIGERIATSAAGLLAMTYVFVGGLKKPGDCHTSVATLVRNDMRYTMVIR